MRQPFFMKKEKVKELEQRIMLEEIVPDICLAEEQWKGNIIICPGGAYKWHSPREALPVAKAFAGQGWKPWILYYSVSEHGEILETIPLCQAAAAVERVRKHCPHKPVVVCGFSAGGHVAASLGVHWNDEAVFAKKEQARIRPDGLILCYPVITAGQYANQESINALAKGEKSSYFSLESYVDRQTPPVFLWHTAADSEVAVLNTLMFANCLAAKEVPFELHIYPYGVHGLSLATKEVEEPQKERYTDAHVAGWFRQCTEWLDIIFFKFTQAET